MELEQRIYQLFEDHLMATQQATEQVAPLISQAAEQVVATLVNDGSVLACGHQEGTLVAQRFCDMMVNRLERERPALPAYFLPIPEQHEAAIAQHCFADHVKAFGHPGDLFFLVTSDGETNDIAQAITVARERGMHIVALTGGDGGRVSQVLTDGDIEIRIPSRSRARVAEIHWLVVHCIGDLVDNLLFGVEDS
jgi:D-sedoheptulose 7-phosphate isomerase